MLDFVFYAQLTETLGHVAIVLILSFAVYKLVKFISVCDQDEFFKR